MWTIGIDGGGTKCKAGIFSDNGDLLAQTISGPANLFVDFNSAITEICQACDALIHKVNSTHSLAIEHAQCRVVAGCAGANILSVNQAFKAWNNPFASAELCSDIYIASVAANQTKPCFLVIVGTGSCFASYNNNNLTQYGGHGFLLGDIASGAWLGKKALSWYLLALENGYRDNALFTTLEHLLGSDVQKIVERYGHGLSSQFAALVPTLLTQQDKSETLESWIVEGAQYIANMIQTHNQLHLPTFILGGLAPLYVPKLAELGINDIREPFFEPIYGAYFYQQQLIRS